MIEKINASPIRRLYEIGANSLSATDEAPSTYFSGLLKDAIQKLNDSQLQADVEINSFLKGDSTDVHRVMIALQKADMTLSLAMQFRNKIIQAYEEVMRMQV